MIATVALQRRTGFILSLALCWLSLPVTPALAQNAAAVPRAVTAARATEIPACSVFVDASAGGGNGTAQSPHKTIGAALEAATAGAIICVAEGTYSETITPGEKHFTLAGGFQRGSGFKVRDSAAHVSKAAGKGSGSFVRFEDPAPKGDARTVVDGFEITGYSRAIVRAFYESGRFDVTNNHIHGNKCTEDGVAGAGVALGNVSGTIAGNVFRNNSCARGGAIFVNDAVSQNTVTVERNLVDGNSGTEPDTAHGGAVYLFSKTLRVTGNLFTRNTVTGWGAGLYLGASPEVRTQAALNWNVYTLNSAGNAGGGMFCDDGAICNSFHEVYYRNCGGNILLDGSAVGQAATVARFDHLTNVGALAAGCKEPGPGVRIDRGDQDAADSYSFVDAIFWGNAPGQDFVASCEKRCDIVKVNVSHSMVQTEHASNGLKVTFGPGIVAPADPMFVAPEAGDFHLKSATGRWTPSGHVADPVTSPLLAKGYPEGKTDQNPERAGRRNELGADGNSSEASYVR
jgi:predicted outer membrane repeat protein